ncbi:CHAT domain-containing protein [Trichocoleus sp. FACHB-591]|uniref:CHAT domain-containing protein n=1 Tax=Trichocoleus sp. FACHB-591 TaxID=2692872 RepID=UPI00168727E6|nr:CHAT domain-containing protein [Trichocoleus sp. FACHB-591]MBD2097705.1 CHAT domain-containing protein [Trichocoleus sp. FACHB-591]
MRIRHPIRPLLAILYLSSFLLCLGLNQVSTAQTPTITQLVQQGVDRYQKGDYKTAVARWRTALEVYPNDPANVVIIQENLARAQQQLGKSDAAIEQWEQVTAYYRQTKDLKSLGHSLTEQAQIYSRLGQSRKSIALLCGQEVHHRLPKIEQLACLPDSALQIARAVNDKKGEAAALGSLGDAQRLLGDYESATTLLKTSLELASDLPAYRIAAQHSLGIAYSSLAQVNYRRAESANQRGDSQEEDRFMIIGKKHDENALQSFRQGLELARSQKDIAGELRSLISAIPAYYRTDKTSTAMEAHQKAKEVLAEVPDSQQRVYAAIDLARLLKPVATKEPSSRSDCLKSALLPQAETLLKQAVDTAQKLEDQRAASFALGEQGHLQECRGNVPQALQLTNQARLAADHSKASDSLYLWEWQTGRILRKQGRNEAAIAAYQRAVTTLEAIRSDILSANRDLQFDFRDTIEPIYRQLVALRLEQEQPIQIKAIPTKAEEFKSEENFKGIVGAIDSLRLAELQNYFGNDCVITVANPTSQNQAVDPTAAIINTFILDNQTAVILSLPNGQKKYFLHKITRQELTNQINAFRQGLQRFRDPVYKPQDAQEVYRWLIEPFVNDLKQIKTLVFVQDGILRSVPMAALHDGKQFLIQQYAVATTPSRSAIDVKPFNRSGLRVLALGLTEAPLVDKKRLPALQKVGPELRGVIGKIPGSKLLKDPQFNRDAMEKELSQTVYPIIHLATHGKFGTDPDDTYIVTGEIVAGENRKLTLTELDRLIREKTRNREPLELLTLTACETAVGDDRSTLGLAGVAIQAGARSALASLWSINDPATAQLAPDFYAKLLDTKLSKAQALQFAQKALIGDANFFHPAYWSPFVLVGNWQ